VPITRVTVIAAVPFDDERAARDWLARCSGRGDEGADEITEALDHVNRAVAAYRVAAADAHAHDVSAERAVRIRIGYGSGPDLVDGAWEDAMLMPAERRPRVRRRMLAPEQELAGIMTGRRPAGRPSEELLLRARQDLDAGRMREAAMQVKVAADALRAELAREESTDSGLTSRVEIAGRLAQAAMAGDLDDAAQADLEKLVTELERAVRRRRYAATD
jgi:hypothetical protein